MKVFWWYIRGGFGRRLIVIMLELGGDDEGDDGNDVGNGGEEVVMEINWRWRWWF